LSATSYGEQSEKESDKNKDLGEELADVVLCIRFNKTVMIYRRYSDKRWI
jgi:endonuclease III-like uncharacterized protein